MQYRNVDNWKTEMKKIARERNLDIQDVQQRYVLEEFAERIGASKYAEMFVLKGGFVVSTLLGLDTRMTRDLDATYRSTIYDTQEMYRIIQEIVDTQIDSFFEYSLKNLKIAQENDYYSGFIAEIEASRDTTRIKLKIDISNNTLIFPNALKSSLTSLFSNKHIHLQTYFIENIIAEKFETTLDRGEYNTRMRDLFDVYLLLKENAHMIDNSLLAQTIIMVSKDRDTLDNLEDCEDIIALLSESKIFNSNFERYKDNQYPNSKVTLNDVFYQFRIINKIIEEYRKLNNVE